MKLNLENKNIIVTGASGGIGKEIVNSLLDEGANILMTGSNEKKLIYFSRELSKKVKYVVCDLQR